MAASTNRGGRPRRPEPVKVIYLRESVRDHWRSQKDSFGYSKLTDSEFAEVLLHSCIVNRPEEERRRRKEGSSLGDVSFSAPPGFCSTPAKKKRTEDLASSFPDASTSDVDITGVDVEAGSLMEVDGFNVAMDDPFSRTRIGNETNPFVDGDGDRSKSSVPGDSDNEQEFNERLSRIVLDLQDDTSSKDSSDSEDDMDEDSERPSLDPAPNEMPCSNEEYFVVDFSDAQTTSTDGSVLDDEFTKSMIDPEADQTAFHEDTITEQESLKAKLQDVYKGDKKERVKRELELSNTAKVLVTVDKIKELISTTCKTCSLPVTIQETKSGAVLLLHWSCDNGHSGTWASSELLTKKNHQKVYVNNVQLAAAVLLSGNNYQKINLLAKFVGLQFISETIFYRIQKLYCFPAVQTMWADVKAAIHGHLPSTGVTLSGDGRNDSPGHTARYCVYTLMEESSRVVVDLEVCDKRETGGKSAAMEKLALSRLLQRLMHVLKIEHIVTDASTSIKALVREMKEQHDELKDLIHDLDIWHKSAKLVKALTDAANLKDCGIIRDWIEPIRNHFWFCCEQANGDVGKLRDMWLGVLHHVVGEHEWHDGQCSHGPLTSSESDKPLLDKGSKAMEALRKVIYDKRWLESLIFYVWFKHTSFLENFNSMMLKYAPKRNSFDFLAFCLRMFLAALDHNLHIFRPQATTKDGQPLWKKQYSKRTKRWHPEAVKEEKSFEYIPYLMASILKGRVDDEESAERVVSLADDHPRHLAPTIALRESPELAELVREYRSRFGSKKI